jgi:hypothetical protein
MLNPAVTVVLLDAEDPVADLLKIISDGASELFTTKEIVNKATLVPSQ